MNVGDGDKRETVEKIGGRVREAECGGAESVLFVCGSRKVIYYILYFTIAEDRSE